jgi:NADPH:quinone reductase-like Zn-dependent oxidoreductase
MKAAVRSTYGPPDVVRVREVATPTPGPSDLLVRVHATTVNRTDCAYRAGTPVAARLVYGLPRPRAAILGCEFAGTIEAAGESVTLFQVGERVFGYNEGPFGGHAEYLVLDQDRPLARIPRGVTYAHAAAATEGAHYALTLIRAAKVRQGHDVLVNGATGAIGSAAVQLLKVFGAHVTAVCATPHLDLVRGLGADRVVDYTAVDFTSDPQRYDVVLDAVGKSSYRQCRGLLKPEGAYLSTELGHHGQNILLALLTAAKRGTKVLFPIPKVDQEMVSFLGDLLERGQFTPVVDSQRTLAQIVEVYQYVETGQKVGNVVVALDGST